MLLKALDVIYPKVGLFALFESLDCIFQIYVSVTPTATMSLE